MTRRDDDESLWSYVLRSVTPMPGRARPKARPLPPRQGAAAPESVSHAAPPIVPPSEDPPQLDGQTARRLKQGKLEIEAKLDLHGMTQAAAQPALISFIRNAQARGCRTVLVITGKGLPKLSSDQPFDRPAGVLRRQLPLWLNDPEIKNIVLSHSPARPKHGGDGAFYVYLRRDKII